MPGSRTLRLCVLAAVAAALLAAGALAATPRQQQYSNPSPAAAPPSVPPATLPAHHVIGTTTKTGGTLPFTGAQLGSFVALGVVLVGAGLAARRLGSSRKG